MGWFLAPGSPIKKFLDFLPQKPLHLAWLQSKSLVQGLEVEVYPATRAVTKAKGTMIYFADESGIRSGYHAGTTRTPLGRTAVVDVTLRRLPLNLNSTVNPRSYLRFVLHIGSVYAKLFKKFIQHFQIGAEGPASLVVAGRPIHKSSH